MSTEYATKIFESLNAEEQEVILAIMRAAKEQDETGRLRILAMLRAKTHQEAVSA